MTITVKISSATGVKDKDLSLWRRWKATQSPVDLQALLTQMNPIVLREVSKWAAGASRSLLEAEGKKLAVEAFKTYDPHRGTALSTHVTTRLQKLSRIIYSTQNSARMSETNVLLFNTYMRANSELSELHGREPTHEELADHLGWSPKKLKSLQKQFARKELVESENHPTETTKDDATVDFIYHDLTPLQKSIFEYRTGYGGKPKIPGAEICKKLGITQGQLSYQVELIIAHVKRVQGTPHAQ